jgi:hypothetical protein
MPDKAPSIAGARKRRTEARESEGSRKRRTQERQGIAHSVALTHVVEREREPTAKAVVHAQRTSRSA